MIIDASHITSADLLEAAVCIVGAGAAGITLACELDGLNESVILLEAGGLHTEPGLIEHYQGHASAPHPDPTQFRRAAFGGTTSLWGGRCVPFDPVDFERRDYVAQSGWPIAYQQLAVHYPKALRYCDAGEFDFSVSGSLPHGRPTIAGFDGGSIVLGDCIERYSLPTDFGRRYRDLIASSGNVRALLHARCLRLLRAPGEDRIAAAEFLDAAGRRRVVRARVFVLATGGIEVPRLLMNSDPEGAGLGNRHDLLGRFYSCHFENKLGRLVPHGAAVAFHFERTADGVYCRRQLRFSPNAQREHRLLNTVFRLHFPDYSDATHGSSVMSTIYLAKSMLVPEYRAILQHGAGDAAVSPTLPHLRNILLGLPQLARFSFDWVFRIQLARRKLPYTLVPNADGSFPLEFNSEQTPMPSNRITIGDDVDRDGMRRVRIAWRLCDDDLQSAQRALLLFRDVMNRGAACRLELDEQSLQERLTRSAPLGGHHLGTARMGATPRSGVVDSDCAVHELPNLFVASSAVFPTSGHANPTLSIVALAVRLASHLKGALQSSGGLRAAT
jgi:choline dehydrogenase-like flavoprotein